MIPALFIIFILLIQVLTRFLHASREVCLLFGNLLANRLREGNMNELWSKF